MYIKIYLDPNDNSQYIVFRISLLKYRHNSHNRIFYRPLFVSFFLPQARVEVWIHYIQSKQKNLPISSLQNSNWRLHFIKLIVTKYGIYLGKNNIIMYISISLWLINKIANILKESCDTNVEQFCCTSSAFRNNYDWYWSRTQH